mmetsp:Transcript_13191/g.15219  ORF Transcript_13191/g.15219 Transcript_13191/m.15219 type:complete len:229 (+) Transcript_13191:162-848(+)
MICICLLTACSLLAYTPITLNDFFFHVFPWPFPAEQIHSKICSFSALFDLDDADASFAFTAAFWLCSFAINLSLALSLSSQCVFAFFCAGGTFSVSSFSTRSISISILFLSLVLLFFAFSTSFDMCDSSNSKPAWLKALTSFFPYSSNRFFSFILRLLSNLACFSASISSRRLCSLRAISCFLFSNLMSIRLFFASAFRIRLSMPCFLIATLRTSSTLKYLQAPVPEK